MGTSDTKTRELAGRVLAGDPRAIARAVRIVDDRDRRFLPLLKAVYPHTGHAYVVGITGAPGAGKSSLVDQLIDTHRKQGRKVAVVAVDPSSPFTGGALLGDRIRMQRHFTDPNVFIRSLATRGHLGGLSRSAGDVTRVLDAAGFDVVIVETVGVGQDELEIARLAHSTCVVMAPGQGDEIQAIKAGILEVADLFVVNKADRDGADATVRDLEQMIALGGEVDHSMSAGAGHGAAAARAGRRAEGGAHDPSEGEWSPPVLRSVATRGEGIDELAEACARHHRYLFDTEQGRRTRARRLREEFGGIFRESLIVGVEARLRTRIEHAAERVAAGQSDPYSEAEVLVQAALGAPDDDTTGDS